MTASGRSGLARRLLPLQIGVGLQGFMLWVPIEKLFQTQIGFDAAAIAAMAAAYAAVVPLLEVPSGILADRRSRTGILIASSVAAAASALLGGLSHNVATYIGAALILGVYFAMNSGTVDSVVYDTVIEETGSPELYERWIGRVRMVESATFATSALAGGLLAGATSPRLTYFVTVPFVLASVAAFSRFREPRLHRAAEPLALRRHVATTVHAMTRIPGVRRMLLLAALTAMLSQAVFEFGPLWLIALHSPAAAFGPYWALLVATLGAGGYLAGQLNLARRTTVFVVAALIAGTPILLVTSHSLLIVAAAQTVLALVLALAGIHAGRLLHDAVPSHIRAGVSSGAGTFSWLLFLPLSLGFGALGRAFGVYAAGWVFVGTGIALAALLALATRAEPAIPAAAKENAHPATQPPPDDLACRQAVQLLSDYLDGDLPPDWRASLADHLTACDGCTTYLDQLRQTVTLLEQLDTRRAAPVTPPAPTDDEPA
ncbi:MAG TPA: MFS transporter [Amycolatopsis sp.]|nr:MFS transporter [Amycolatopsis sp.]